MKHDLTQCLSKVRSLKRTHEGFIHLRSSLKADHMTSISGRFQPRVNIANIIRPQSMGEPIALIA